MSLQVFAIIAQLCLLPSGTSHVFKIREIQADCQIKMTKCVLATTKKHKSADFDFLIEKSQAQAIANCIVDGRTK